MAEAHIQLQRGRRYGRRIGGGTTPPTLLPLRRVSSNLSNSVSCWYCDFKSPVFNEPLFHIGRKYSRWLRIWFSIGMGFSLTTLIGVTITILLETARALNLYSSMPWLNNTLNGSIFGFYSSVLKNSISVSDVAYMCISTIISVSIHELGHALAATSEGIQIEYTAVFLAIIFPGALVAFNDDLLQMIPRVATLRIYCAGIWHNAALCVVCALTLFLLPFIFYPLCYHGESLMVLDVSPKSPLYSYLSPGDTINMLDGTHVRTTKEWIDISYFLDKQKSQTNKGYCVPNLEIAGSKNAEIEDEKYTCPNDLTLLSTIPCLDSKTINETDYQLTKQHIYCFPAKGVLGEKKCGDGWGNIGKGESNCLCTEDESCSSPIHMPGVTWVEITFSRRECGNKESECGGSFVFVGDVKSMARSIWLTEYKSRWFYGVVYIPVVLEKLLVNTFHVSLMLALLNSLPVYYLDGESILEVALCCFSSLTPRIRELVLRLCLVVGTFVCCVLILRMLLLVIS